MANGNSKCMLCYYHGYNSFLGITCDYILVTGKKRGCEPGKKCKRFKKGQRNPKEPFKDAYGD